MSKLLAPNGKPSNLTPEQYKLVRSSNFKKWFGDWENEPENASKVVDENGEPLVVYHGSNKKFDSFRADENQYSYFTSDINLADIYAIHRSKKSNGEKFRYDIYLKIINPLIIDANFESWDNISTKSIENSDIAIKDLLKRGVDTITTNFAPKIAIKNGFDGVIISNIYDGVGYGKDAELSNVYVALKPNQIKLADGTNTTFDGNNPDIRFNNGGSVLLAPNGKPSNLTPEQYKLVKTPEFKEWFGDWEKDPKNSSKVIDNNGEPLVVYHNSESKFNIFDKSKNKLSLYGEGIYFTNIKNEYISKGKNLYEVFLCLKEPFIIDFENKNKEVYIYKNQEFDIDEILRQKRDIEKGVIIRNPPIRPKDKRYTLNERTYYIAGEPNQIKLADGTNTTFDGSNPDIRFNNGGEVKTGLFAQIWEWFGIKF